MRVGFFLPGSLDLISGGFIYDRMLVAGMRAAGIEVDVVPLPWRRGPRALLDNLARIDGDWDLVLQDELAHPSLFLRNRRLRARTKVVALVHNLGRRPAAPIERAYLRGLDGAIAVCRSTLDDVRAAAGAALPAEVVYAGRDHVAPALDDGAIAARAVEGPLRLLFAGAVRPHKGLHRLLGALGALEGVDWTLEVAGDLRGDPDHARAIARQAARHGPRVRLRGELTGEPLRAAFGRSHLLVLPSDREAYPLAALEAMGFGLPVLVTRNGGTGELVTDGSDGLLLDPVDPGGWVAALRALAGDRGRVVAMGCAARARWRRHGTWAEAAAKVSAFLEALGRRSARTGAAPPAPTAPAAPPPAEATPPSP